MDFLLHLGDGCPAGLPLVQSNINRSNADAGFTIPMLMWKQALGPQQFATLAECLQVLYRSCAGWCGDILTLISCLDMRTGTRVAASVKWHVVKVIHPAL